MHPRSLLTSLLSVLLCIPAARAAVSASADWQNLNTGSTTRYNLAYDAGGYLFATDSSAAVRGIRAFSPSAASGGAAPSFYIGQGDFASTFPATVAVHPITNHLYAQSAAGEFSVYSYDTATQTYASLDPVQPFTGLSPYLTADQMTFSPDGELMFVSFADSDGNSLNNQANVSVVRVARRGAGDSWTDTGAPISPEGFVTPPSPDPRRNQGYCTGLAADANGNLWVSSAADPVSWNGVTTYTVNPSGYVRPLRFYMREPDDTFVLTAEIPVDQRISGLAIGANGLLFATDGRQRDTASAGTSHRLHVYQGLTRLASIDTSSDGLINLRAVALDTADNPVVYGTDARKLMHWTISGVPAPTMCTVGGKVNDAITGLPIAGAVVRIFNQRAVTDASGHYTAAVQTSATGSGPSAPYCIVTADSAGYLRTKRSPVILAGNTTMDLTLTPAASAFVETTVGAVDIAAGLARADQSDSDTTDAVAGAESIRRTYGNVAAPVADTGNSVKDLRMSMDLDSAFFPGASAQPVYITTRWLDDTLVTGSSGWRIAFRPGIGGTATTSAPVARAGTGGMVTTSVYMGNGIAPLTGGWGADFTLNEQSTGSLGFACVAVTKAPPAVVYDGTPAGFAGGMAIAGKSFVGAPTVFNGAVYAGTDGGGLVALDAASGAPRTQFGANGTAATAGEVAGRPVIFITPDQLAHVCIATRTGHVAVYRADTGALEWEAQPLEDATCASAPAVYVDTSTGIATPLVYVGLTQNGAGHLVRVRVDAPTTDLLDLPIGTEITSAPALTPGGSQVMIGYTDAGDGHLLSAINPRLAGGENVLTVLREVAVVGEPIRVPPVLSGDGRTMIVGSSAGATGHLVAFNPANAQETWSAPMAGVELPPWVDYPAKSNAADADTIFVGTTDGFIHSIDLVSGNEHAGWPVRPVPGRVGGSLFTLNDKLYVGGDLGMLVLSPANPADVRLFSPAVAVTSDQSGTAATAIAPGFNAGASAGGRAAGASIIAMTGSDGKMHAMYVQ